MGCVNSKADDPAERAELIKKDENGYSQAQESGEKKEGFFGSLFHKATNAVTNAVESVTNPYEAFEAKLEVCVMKTLNWVSPKAADKVQKQVEAKVPGGGGANIAQTANRTVREHIMESKDRIIDMCQDVLENLNDGKKPIKALKAAFQRVGVLMLRVVKGAVAAGVLAVLGCCCCLCLCMIAVKEIVTKIFSELVRLIKKHLKKILSAKAPDWLVNRLPWNWNHETDIGNEKPRAEEKREAGEQTARQKLGLPDHEPKADKEATKPSKKLRNGLLAGAAVGAVGAGALGAAYYYGESTGDEDDDDTDDEDWCDDDDDSDNEEDYDAAEGEPDEEDDDEAPQEEEAAPEEAAEEEPPPEEEEPPPEEEEPPPEEEEAPPEEEEAVEEEEPPPEEEMEPPEEEPPEEEPPEEEEPPPEDE